jgi:hypothetical protein
VRIAVGVVDVGRVVVVVCAGVVIAVAAASVVVVVVGGCAGMLLQMQAYLQLDLL